ncbi:MAG: S8 family serine peptidase [Gaiellaceae bacterium]
MRRALVLFVLPAALLLTAGSASANLHRILLPRHGDRVLPRVRHGVIRIPAGHASGRVTVIVDLKAPPLAAAYGHGLDAAGQRRPLNVHSATSRAYLARLARLQAQAAAQIRRAIPQARIQLRYRVVLDGFSLRLPYRALPTLARLQAVTKIYPSIAYRLNTNKSPSVIHADQFWANTGGFGQGIKIGVVDDGIDQTNPFFNPAGFSYPAGFPKGNTKFTTPKVIVARSFPGPGSGKLGKLPLVRTQSFHGTHVSGIAAGVQGTIAPPGPDHPLVTGLSGIAPRAWLGNYRVFNAPVLTGGYDAFTPQIVQAFEAVVNDGMNVLNFSGGGPEVDPSSDALIEATDNVAAAGVVPVISAGNDRDDFGLGTVGTPSNAPDAISVAAVSNLHVFGPELDVTAAGAPANVQHIPFSFNLEVPPGWQQFDQLLQDVGTITGTDGHPVDRQLCAPAGFDPNDGTKSSLPAGSLGGLVALVTRGGCTFDSKVERIQHAGGTGIIVVDNRFGEANFIPELLAIPGGMVSDLDGANLRAFLDAHGGRTTFRATGQNNPLEIQTGRSGIVTSFSSAGPTNFTHMLKPDVAAPGGQILSSTLTEFAGSNFVVLDGTSMAAPHVTGSAALLLQQHPTWTPAQVKSALMTTAGPAWGNTARTQEASVLLEGAGLVNVYAADSPKLFADPSSLSFGFLNTDHAAARKPLLVSLSDAGGGAGAWTVSIDAQSASAGATVTPEESVVTVPPGGTVDVPVVAAAPRFSPRGDNTGFVVFTRGADRIRVPYYFTVVLPQVGRAPRVTIKRNQLDDTSKGTDFVDVYRFPSEPFGPGKNYTDPGMHEDGGEHVYTVHVDRQIANAGAAITAAGFGALPEPWFLGSLNEDDVQGYPGTPVNVNGLTFEYGFDNQAAGIEFPHQGRYFVAVDSRADPFTDQSLKGPYLLHFWQNDVKPPRLRFLTTHVTTGRPALAAIVKDRGSGVDPTSLVLGYRGILLQAAFYDPGSGLALWLLDGAPKIPAGKTPAIAVGSDYQESKNVDQAGANILPNTAFERLRLHGVNRPTVSWLLPGRNACVAKTETLIVSAGSPHRVKTVAFYVGHHRISTDKGGFFGLYAAVWRAGKAAHGRHVLRAVVTDRKGAHAQARQLVRVCRR